MSQKSDKNELKKEYLKEYECAVRQMKRYEEKIQEMRLNKMYPSVVLDGMPRTHNKNDLSSYAAMLDQEERRYMKARYKRVKKCKEISDKIERLECEDEKDVLMYRYVKLMKWDDICDRLGYSWKQIHRIHVRALDNFKMT